MSYQIFRKACKIKYNKRRASLSRDEYKEVLELKSQMNTKLNKEDVKEWNDSNIDIKSISPGWIVGFVEAEGTFGMKLDNPYFQVVQSSTSNSSLELIVNYFNTLASKYAEKYPLLGAQKSFFLRYDSKSKELKKDPVTSYLSSSHAFIYYIIISFFYRFPMYSRKRIDFRLWATIVTGPAWWARPAGPSPVLKERGYYFSSDGKVLIRRIANSMNHRRYSTHKPTQEEILIGTVTLTEIKTMLNSNPGKLSVPSSYYIYDKELNSISANMDIAGLFNNPQHLLQIEGSPFTSQRAAASALAKILNHGGPRHEVSGVPLGR